MAAITAAVAATAAVVGTGVSLIGAARQRSQAKEAAYVAGETAEENRIRREAALKQREELLSTERAYTEIERQREIRTRLNQARAAQAEQQAASYQLGINTGISAVATSFASQVGFANEQFARETVVTDLEREQQDILTGLTPISELKGETTPVKQAAPVRNYVVNTSSFNRPPPAVNTSFIRPRPAVNTSVPRKSG